MRIFFLYPYLPSPEAAHGSARIVSRILQELRTRVEITLVCAYRPGERRLVDSVKPLCANLFAVERAFVSDMNAVRRVSHSTSTGLRLVTTGYPLPVVKLRTPAMKRTVEQALATGPFDAYHVELAIMAQFADLWDRGSPSLLVDHEAAGPPGEEEHRWAEYVREVYTRFTQVMTLTEEDRDDLLGIEPRLRIAVRPPGIDVPKKLARRPEKDRVLFFGSSAHRPNRDALKWIAEDILPELRRRRPKAEVYCAGFTDDSEEEQLAKEAGVKLLGYVEDLAAEIARASVVISPVRIGRGIRIKNLEAMAHGAPLVTTGLGSRGFGKLDADAFVVADGAVRFADAIADLLDDPAKAKQLGAKAHETIRSLFNVKTQAELTLEAWRRLPLGR